ncbi:MAG: hypothetical protein ABEK04_04790 [Candidatus Nanohalobium sp.]
MARRQDTSKEPVPVNGRPSTVDSDWIMPDWDLRDIKKAEKVIRDITKAFPDHEFPDGLRVKETSGTGYYHSRFGDKEPGVRPLVEVNSELRDEVLAHELGHDVLTASEVSIEAPMLIRSTFSEAFADLIALTYTDVEPYDRGLDRDPRKRLKPYRKLEEALDQDKRTREGEALFNVGISVYEDDFSEAASRAYEIARRDLDVGDLVSVDEIRFEEDREEEHVWKLAEDSPRYTPDNAFISNLEVGEASYCDIVENEIDIWRMTEVLAHKDRFSIEEPVKKAYHENGRIAEGLHSTAEAMFEKPSLENVSGNAEEVIEQTIHEKIDETYRMIDDYVEGLESADLPEEVVESLGNVRYGNDYGEAVDYPHNVGGQYAEALYRQGVLPHDLLADPEIHSSVLQTKIRQEVSKNT